MKFIYILLLIFNIFTLNYCLFKNSKYVKELPNVATLDEQLNNSNITIGMMLIYSKSCGFCHSFAKIFDQLAEKYNDSMLFFAMRVQSDYYKRMPSTNAIPYILFFSDGYFYVHKKRRSFNELSNIIENNYLTRCREITYKNIPNVYYNVFMKNETKYNNLIIGYFDENSKDDIENFKMSTKLMCPECVGLCYICKDFNDNKNKNAKNKLLKYIKNHIIIGYLHNNNSKIFLWDSKDKKTNDMENNDQLVNIDIKFENFNPVIHKRYQDFINNDLKLEYYNIDCKQKTYLINFLRNKNNYFFSYLTNEEKKLYENNIKEVLNISEKAVLSSINLVLYNYNEIQDKNLKYINKKGIYEINEELTLIKEYKNLNKLIDNILKDYELNKQKYEINNNPLIPDVKKEDLDMENPYPYEDDVFLEELFFKILEKICVVLFTIVITFAMFSGIHSIYYSKVDKELVDSNSRKRSK